MATTEQSWFLFAVVLAMLFSGELGNGQNMAQGKTGKYYRYRWRYFLSALKFLDVG